MEIYTSNLSNSLSEYGECFIEFIEDGIRQKLFYQNISEHQMSNFLITIRKTCELVEKNFEGIYRQSGEHREYHSHLYEVAKLYLEYAGEGATISGLIIALRHDDIEDLHPDSKSKVVVEFCDVLCENGIYCAAGVASLTKPKTIHIDETRKTISSMSISPQKKKELLEKLRQEQKYERDNYYYRNFKNLESIESYLRLVLENYGYTLEINEIENLARDVAIIRIVDRIHNLKTMPESGYDNEKRLRKLQNTDNFLIPLALSLEAPDLYGKLVGALIQGYTTYFRVKNSA